MLNQGYVLNLPARGGVDSDDNDFEMDVIVPSACEQCDFTWRIIVPVEGKPYTFTATGLPDGIDMDADGLITPGKPEIGDHVITWTAVDRLGRRASIRKGVSISETDFDAFQIFIEVPEFKDVEGYGWSQFSTVGIRMSAFDIGPETRIFWDFGTGSWTEGDLSGVRDEDEDEFLYTEEMLQPPAPGSIFKWKIHKPLERPECRMNFCNNYDYQYQTLEDYPDSGDRIPETIILKRFLIPEGPPGWSFDTIRSMWRFMFGLDQDMFGAYDCRCYFPDTTTYYAEEDIRQRHLKSVHQDYLLNCQGLTGIMGVFGKPDMMYETNEPFGLREIPFGLMRGNTRLGDISYLFDGSEIKEIPERLFENIDGDSTSGSGPSFRGVFMGCKNLRSIPGDIFPYRTRELDSCFAESGLIDVDDFTADLHYLQRVGSIFRNSRNLRTVSSTLFSQESNPLLYNNTESSFNEAFYGCQRLIRAPRVFDHTSESHHTGPYGSDRDDSWTYSNNRCFYGWYSETNDETPMHMEGSDPNRNAIAWYWGGDYYTPRLSAPFNVIPSYPSTNNPLDYYVPGNQYSRVFTANRGLAPFTFTWDQELLPTGFTFTPSLNKGPTCTLSGVSGDVGHRTCGLTVTDVLGGQDHLEFDLEDTNIDPGLNLIPPPPLPDGQIFESYFRSVYTTGGTTQNKIVTVQDVPDFLVSDIISTGYRGDKRINFHTPTHTTWNELGQAITTYDELPKESKGNYIITIKAEDTGDGSSVTVPYPLKIKDCYTGGQLGDTWRSDNFYRSAQLWSNTIRGSTFTTNITSGARNYCHDCDLYIEIQWYGWLQTRPSHNFKKVLRLRHNDGFKLWILHEPVTFTHLSNWRIRVMLQSPSLVPYNGLGPDTIEITEGVQLTAMEEGRWVGGMRVRTGVPNNLSHLYIPPKWVWDPWGYPMDIASNDPFFVPGP